MRDGKSKLEVQRFKGLGEMDANQLWDTTMDPDQRTLVKVTIEDGKTCDKQVSTLMGNNAEKRRIWIEKNIDFTLEEDYKADHE